ELRNKNGLTLEELASRSEVTKGFLSQLERDLTSPNISALEDILEALGSNLSEFFSQPEKEKIVFSKEDYFVDEKENETIQWIVPNAQKNDMEPILLTLHPKQRTRLIKSHEGQEFGYVLKGSLCLVIGEEQWKVKTGETFYCSGNQSHYLFNPHAKEATVLWVSTPPVF
ncbi:MAG: helix-turn-helix transcriptional regulator, partial [Erysipelotrichaceae bacterium]|nr:helix-turn-helix transcriptional regulator [Erysipelotrichaceae bacterium]